MFARILILTLAIFMVFGALVIAEEQEMMAKGEHATFEGKLVCLGCTLKHEEGARSECTAFGHTFALQTKDGKFISFLKNKYSEDLFKGDEKYAGKDITVHGVYYADGNVLDVESFDFGDKQVTWCDVHHKMDTCHSE